MRAGVRVLLVDDDPEQLAALALLLEDRGLSVETAQSGPEALGRIATHPPDVLVVDAAMPEIGGLEVIRRAHLINPALPAAIVARFRPIYTLLDKKYYFDRFNDWFFAGGTRGIGRFASVVGDRTIIDGLLVNGSAKVVGFIAREFRRIQSGYVYHYAFVMIVGVFVLLYWWGVR